MLARVTIHVLLTSSNIPCEAREEVDPNFVTLFGDMTTSWMKSWRMFIATNTHSMGSP